MKKWMLLALIIVLLFVVAPAYAQEPSEPPEPTQVAGDWLFALLGLAPVVLNVAGAGGIVGGLIDLAKLTGKLKDGQAQRVSILVNFILWAILWVAGRYGATAEVEAAIAKLGIFLPSLATFIAMVGGAKIVHAVMKWLDEQSFSLSSKLSSKPKSIGFPEKLAEFD